MKEHYIIHSQSERGYWSNEMGWVYTPADADRYTRNERIANPNLPLASSMDARWVSVHENLPVYTDD